MVAAASSGAVAVSDAVLGTPVALFEGPHNVALTAHFDPSGQRVVTAARDGTASLWDAASRHRRWSAPSIGDDCGIATSLQPDRRFIAVGCEHQRTRIYDTARDQVIGELPGVTEVGGDFVPTLPAITEAGDRAAIAGGNAVAIYELPSGRLLRTIRHPAAVSAVAFAATGHDLISGAIDGSVLVTRDDRAPIALPFATPPVGIDAAGFLTDGRLVATDTGKRLRVFDPDGSAALAELTMPSRMNLLRSAADGQLVTLPIYWSKAAPPVLWDLQRYRLIARLEGHIGRVFGARFVAGGRILTAGGDGTARLWDAATGELRQTYRGSSVFLADAVLSPDGSMIVAGTGDGLLRFWDTASEHPLWKMPAHRPYVIALHFEGDDLVTRGFTGDVARWHLAAPSSIIQACAARADCAALFK